MKNETNKKIEVKCVYVRTLNIKLRKKNNREILQSGKERRKKNYWDSMKWRELQLKDPSSMRWVGGKKNELNIFLTKIIIQISSKAHFDRVINPPKTH